MRKSLWQCHSNLKNRTFRELSSIDYRTANIIDNTCWKKCGYVFVIQINFRKLFRKIDIKVDIKIEMNLVRRQCLRTLWSNINSQNISYSLSRASSFKSAFSLENLYPGSKLKLYTPIFVSVYWSTNTYIINNIDSVYVLFL